MSTGIFFVRTYILLREPILVRFQKPAFTGNFFYLVYSYVSLELIYQVSVEKNELGITSASKFNIFVYLWKEALAIVFM